MIPTATAVRPDGIVALTVSADTLTPVAAALRLRDRLAFILESVEGGARYGRYSHVGVRGRMLTVDALQTNHEGALIDRLEQRDYDAVIINPGALAHTSIALHDAILGAERPTVEVHISDIRQREPFRRVSVVEPAVSHTIMGRGWRGYLDAVDWLLQQDKEQTP